MEEVTKFSIKTALHYTDILKEGSTERKTAINARACERHYYQQAASYAYALWFHYEEQGRIAVYRDMFETDIQRMVNRLADLQYNRGARTFTLTKIFLMLIDLSQAMAMHAVELNPKELFTNTKGI
jgi:hypothetical protein